MPGWNNRPGQAEGMVLWLPFRILFCTVILLLFFCTVCSGAPVTITFNGDLTITPNVTANIPVGGTVVWVNDDPLKPHGILALSTQTGDYFGSMNTVLIPYGTSLDVTFDHEGSYDYRTVFQPEMDGQIIVSGENPPTEQPIANFTGIPRTGTTPLTVNFTDTSTGNPTGWAWFFGDENYSAPWTLMNGSAGWEQRMGHSSVALPDGSIVLMGGAEFYGGNLIYHNDTWRSTDKGTTWALMNASSGWGAREYHTSVTMPDGSIVLVGGEAAPGSSSDFYNDTWRSTDKGVTWTLMGTSPGWTARLGHSSVAMPDGSIVLMGGYLVNVYGALFMNDAWRSTDNGATWTRMNASAGWSGRYCHQSVVTSDGNILLMGGYVNSGENNDVWRSEDNGATWMLVNARAVWAPRILQSSMVMPDDSIVLVGGEQDTGTPLNDVWRSTDYGATWMLVNASAGWAPRLWQRSVVLPDGSIILMGSEFSNDVWRFNPSGSNEQNPSHTYTKPGNYPVTLQVSNGGGYNSTQKAKYITVTSPAPVPSKISITNGAAWYLDSDGTGNTANATFHYFGAPGWAPIVGDWNGDGKSEMGIYRDGAWYLDSDGTGNPANATFHFFGAPGWTPIVGDWNGDEKTEIGIYRDGAWYLDTSGTGNPTTATFHFFGAPGWTSIVGDWG